MLELVISWAIDQRKLPFDGRCRSLTDTENVHVEQLEPDQTVEHQATRIPPLVFTTGKKK
jgi:hypothetical protein